MPLTTEADERFAFVLVRPKAAGNIGAAARAVKNMGFSDLRLVAPEASPTSRPALAMAVHARDVLKSARIFPSLGKALEGLSLSVGTTCRTGLYRSSIAPLREGVSELVGLSTSNRVGVVFGAEDTGLTNREIKLCQRLVTIPTAPDYTSLNLAQAVMVVAYELMMATQPGATPEAAAPEFAPASEVDAMLERMKQAYMAIGFLPDDNPEHIMFALRALFGRSGLTTREVDILNGVARQTKWAAEGGHRTLERKRLRGEKLR